MNLEQAIAKYLEEVSCDNPLGRQEFLSAHPSHASGLAAFFDLLDHNAPSLPEPNDLTVDSGNSDPMTIDFTMDAKGDGREAVPLNSRQLDSRGPERVAAPKSDGRAKSIGNYKLLQKIAEGGMGAVWMAEQQRPVRRRVALKLIKAGQDTDQIIARFDAERQALAMMEHQNIAKMLDGGQTEDGLPYFVMELVQGIPITKYCDQNRLSLQERLELFIPVCHAVQHAHQKGIIHRDLKPSNILVTLYDGKPVPKVIDFGLAKATQHQSRLTDKTMFTEFGQVVGTLQYMSPEQAEMNTLDIDTRTDIYALGVLLYELLTGSTPIDRATLENVAIFKILEAIRTKEPPRPSIRLSSSKDAIAGISEQRKVTVDKLHGILKGELDWVVMKALEKDRTRRYETANAFAEDVARYLNNEPLKARPPSRLYVARKFVRKNRAAVVSAVSMTVLLILGFIGTSVGMYIAIDQRQRAEHAESQEKLRSQELNLRGDELEEITKFQQKQLTQIDSALMGTQLKESILHNYRAHIEKLDSAATVAIPSTESLERGLSQINFTDLANQALDSSIFSPAAKTIEANYKDQPLFQAKMYLTLGTALRYIGMTGSARVPIQHSIDLMVRTLGAGHESALEAKLEMAHLISDQGKVAESLELYQSILEECRNSLDGEHPVTRIAIGALAGALEDAARYDEAEKLFRENLDYRRRTLPANDTKVLASLGDLALCLRSQSKFAEAESLHLQCVAITTEAYGPDHVDTLIAKHNLSALLFSEERYEECVKMDIEVLEGLRRLLGNDHVKTLSAINNLAATYVTLNKPELAEPLYLEAISASTRINGIDHPGTLMTMSNMALLLSTLGKNDESLAMHLIVTERRRVVLGDSHPKTIDSIGHIAQAFLDQEKDEQALPWLREFYQRSKLEQVGFGLIETLLRLGLDDEAGAKSKELRQLIETNSIRDAKRRGEQLTKLAWCYINTERYELASPILNEAKRNLEEANSMTSESGIEVVQMLEEVRKYSVQ